MRAVLLVVAMLIGVVWVQAEDAPVDAAELAVRQASVKKLLSLLKMEQNYNTMMDQVLAMQAMMIAKQEMSVEEKAQAMEAVKEAMAVTREKLGYERMETMFVEVFAEVFTNEEIEGLIGFYQSPVGQKFVEKQPQLNQAMMGRMQTIMGEIAADVQERIKAKLAEPAPAKEPLEE